LNVDDLIDADVAPGVQIDLAALEPTVGHQHAVGSDVDTDNDRDRTTDAEAGSGCSRYRNRLDRHRAGGFDGRTLRITVGNRALP
jgi:hypothetical protein